MCFFGITLQGKFLFTINSFSKIQRIVLSYIVSIFCGFLLIYLFTIDINSMTFNNQKITLPFSSNNSEQINKYQIYKFKANSKISREITLSIIVDDIIKSIALNGKELNLSYMKHRYKLTNLEDWKHGFKFNVFLEKGENTFVIKGFNRMGGYAFNVKKLVSYKEYIIIFIFCFLPFFYSTYLLFFYLIEKVKK